MLTTLTRKEMSSYLGKRKHASQMNRNEKRILWARLREIKAKEWGVKIHALDRIEEKGINATRQDLISTIHNSEIIEYKIDDCRFGYDERVLVRANALVNGDYNLNVVYSLTTKDVITVWINHIDDKHETLDWAIYDENMIVFRG